MIITIIRLINAVINLLFKQDLKSCSNCNNYLVSVLIPARNEEKNISNILNDLRNQNYKNIEIIVFDDNSSDNTLEIVKSIANIDERVNFITSEILPEEWLGKNYACHSLALKAKGDFLLFLDADVRIKNDIINKAVTELIKNNLGLLSIFPKQIMLTKGEFFTVPIMNYILLTLLPLVLVKKTKFPSISAANGQFMLFEQNIYFNFLPHKKVRNKKVEDICIARYFKNNNIKISCIVGNTDINCRMYTSYQDAITGFSKNLKMFFGNSILITIVFWLITSFGFLAVFVVFGLIAMLFYFLIIIFIKIIVSYVSRQSIFKNLIFSILQQISLGLIIFKIIKNQNNKSLIWKDRNIS